MANLFNPSTEKKPSKVEVIKENSQGLYGPIGGELGLDSDHFTEESVQVLKHHGVYQQDNRDTRLARKKQKLDREYYMMVRTKFPGGAISAEQYLVCDDLARKYGQHDLRMTTRQCFQFHGVIKADLRNVVHDLNALARITTIGACGDVARNTTASPVADIDPAYADLGIDLQGLARRISDAFMARTPAYYDLWVDDEKVRVNDDGTLTYAAGAPSEPVEEPIYGTTYLPRKFKMGVATDFDNSIDVYTNDIGIIAATENGRLAGFEVLVGGGLGHSHGRKGTTYPRLASAFAYVKDEAELMELLETIVKVQRDFGDRSNRKHARMKYLIDDLGLDGFKEKVFEYAGRSYEPPRGIAPTKQPDYLGWFEQTQPGLNYVGLWVENGRIKDTDERQVFAGIREIAERFRPSIRLTAQQNVVLAGIRDEDVEAVQALLDEYNLPTEKGISAVRRLEMACPALPLCPLATSEAERVMPRLMDTIEQGGHADADVTIRMSGCPNSCSRPTTAEIGIIGKGPDQYILYVGGNHGTRKNEELLPVVKFDELGAIICALFDAWKADRHEGEPFGDWAARTGLDRLREVAEAPAAT